MTTRFPQVEFYIGSRSLMVPPNFITSFTYEDTVKMRGDRWTLELVDRSWKILENDLIPSIQANKDKAVRFRFGWGGSRMSPLRYGTVTEYTPSEITRGGIRITLAGFDQGSASESAQQARQKTYTGKISDVASQIAKNNGWGEDIEETTEVFELEGRSAGKKLRKWRQSNKTDLEFLNELAQRTTPKSGEGAAYRVYFDSAVNPPVLHFHAERAMRYPIREYVLQTDKLGEIISFTPEIRETRPILIGASNSHLIYRDPYTRKPVEEVAEPSTFKDGVATGKKSPVLGGNVVRHHIPPSTKEEAESRLKTFYEALSWNGQPATLELVGDETLVPQRFVNVTVMTPSHERYFISGIYLVLSVTHQISGGEYTCSLSMKKNAFDVGNLKLAKGVVSK